MSMTRLKVVETHQDEPTAITGPHIRVALATQDMKSLNAHFGSASRFAVYDVSQDGWNFVEALSFGDVSDESGKHKVEGDDRITPKIEALAGCHLLFCLAIGGPSAAKAVSAGIHPIKMPAAQPFETVLARTRDMLKGSPPPWLRKVLTGAGFAAKPSFAEEE